MTTTNNIKVDYYTYLDTLKFTKYAVIDSRCRGDILNDTDDFTYSFNTTLTITKYCKLIYASIPNTFNLINKNNNTFRFDNNGTILNLTLDEGNYNINNLADEIQRVVCNALGNNNFTVTYKENQNKYIYTYDNNINGNFYLDFTQNKGDLHSFFGFNKNGRFQLALVNGVSKYQLTSNSCIDMTGPPFVSLFIKEFGNINYNFSELHPYFKTSYLIPITSAPNNINILMDKSS